MHTRKEFAEQHKWKNLRDSALLLLGMGSLLSFVGYLLLGWTGLALGVGLWVVSSLVSPRLSPYFLRRMFQAELLKRHEAPRLYELVEELSERAGLEVSPTLLFVPGPQLNAFAVGSREQPMIGVTQGLLRSLDNRELTAVLAHEIAHIQNNDLRVMGLANAMTRLTSLLSFFGLLLLFFSIPAMWFAGQTVPVTLILLLVMAPVLHRLMLLALSRTREFDADLGAALLTNDPRGLAQALQKIDYFTNGWFRSLFWPSGQRQPQASVLLSHPPTAERVQRLLDIADDRGYEWESRSRIREVVLFSHNLFSTPRLRRRRIRWY